MLSELRSNPVVFGYVGGEWQMGLGRHSALMHALAEHVPVVLLSGAKPGRFPRPRPMELDRRTERLSVVRHVHQWQRTGMGRRLRRWAWRLDALQLHRFLVRQGLGDYVLWLLHDDLARWRGMNLDRLVFDSIDPCFRPEWQGAHDRREQELASQAKVVFCTAESLLDRVRPLNDASYLLPNGCAEDSFMVKGAARSGGVAVAGYLGTFDERVDVGFLERLAEGVPEVRFVLAGRINRDQEPRLAGLGRMPNVDLLGAVSYEAGHELLGSFDVGLIPFEAGEVGDAINPVKMHMYMAAGKPVVSTGIRECVRMGEPCVYVASDRSNAPAVLRRALAAAGNGTRERRLEIARENTWRVRAASAVEILRRHGVLNGGAS